MLLWRKSWLNILWIFTCNSFRNFPSVHTGTLRFRPSANNTAFLCIQVFSIYALIALISFNIFLYHPWRSEQSVLVLPVVKVLFRLVWLSSSPICERYWFLNCFDHCVTQWRLWSGYQFTGKALGRANLVFWRGIQRDEVHFLTWHESTWLGFSVSCQTLECGPVKKSGCLCWFCVCLG